MSSQASPSTQPQPNGSTAPPPAVVKSPVIGQPVWFYADREHTKGMKCVDEAQPFIAFVASAPTARVVNILAIDHLGTSFPLQNVPLFHDDDKDDHTVAAHCELSPPEPKQTFPLAGTVGEPIALGLATSITGEEHAGAALAGLKLTFLVPPGNSFAFTSAAAAFSQVYAANAKPQILMTPPAQIEAGILTDLALTVGQPADVLLSVTATELLADGMIGRTLSFDEAITVDAAPVEPVEPAQPASGATTAAPAARTGVAAAPPT